MRQSQRTVFFSDCVAVFQGGGCRGAAFAGAFAAATAAGVGVAAVAGTSAGSIVTALIGAGADADYLSRVLNSLDFTSLLQSPDGPPSHPVINALLRPLLRGKLDAARKLLFYQGLHSTRGLENWVDQKLAELRPTAPRPVRFGDLVLPTRIIATDLITRRARVWSTEQDDQEAVAHAVSGSCAIPGFFQPVDGRYVDGGVLSNLPTFAVGERERSAPRRVLAFTLHDSAGASSNLSEPIELLSGLTDAVVNGAQALQLDLQRGEIHEIRIDSGDVKATDFATMDSKRVEFLYNRGRTATEQFFQNEATEVYPVSSTGKTTDPFETNTELARLFLNANNRIVVSWNSTRWVYELFPALLVARYGSKQIDVLIPPNITEDSGEAYRRLLLERLGVRLVETRDLPPFCFMVDPDQPLRAAAVVLADVPSIHAAIYHASDGHEAAVSVLYKDFERALPAEQGSTSSVPVLESVPDSTVVSSIRAVRQYSEQSVTISMEEVPLDQIYTFARYAPAFKYLQAGAIARVLRDAGLPAYGPAQVRFQPVGRSLIVPPVFEHSGERFVLINGTSRCLAALREGSRTVRGAVARGVSAEPPARNPRPLRRVTVDIGRDSPNDRYDAFAYAQFRKTEASVHTIESLS